jgi:tRNA(adenine34) deaminase
MNYFAPHNNCLWNEESVRKMRGTISSMLSVSLQRRRLSRNVATVPSFAFCQWWRVIILPMLSSVPMAEDLHFMQLALEEARGSAAAGEVPIGAVLVQESRVLARSGNRTIRDNDPTAHAEIVVIRETARLLGNYRLVDTTLYVTLEPCAMCAGGIIQARIPRLVYGADDPKGGAFRSCFELLTSPKLNHRVEVTSGALAQEAASLLQSFFSSRR